MRRRRASLESLLVRWYRALWALAKTHDWNLHDDPTRRLWRDRQRAGRRMNDELWRTARECHLRAKARTRKRGRR